MDERRQEVRLDREPAVGGLDVVAAADAGDFGGEGAAVFVGRDVLDD